MKMIEAKKVVPLIRLILFDNPNIEKICKGMQDVVNIHTIEAEPVRHGRWEFLGPNRLIGDCMCGTCSVCKVRCKYIVNKNICPNCGANMDCGANMESEE